MKRLFFALMLAVGPTTVSADDYWVTQLRAAPGNFPALLDLVKNTDWKAMGEDAPILMRHSQGNHWDLMLLGQHSENHCNHSCQSTVGAFEGQLEALVDFELSFQATSETGWQQLKANAQNAGMFHIEMFNAAAAKHAALLRQRKIENDYLAKTGQVTNAIFVVSFGSDIDIFTIGFHESMESFAKAGPPSPEAAEKAAVEAGFKNRADISFHLRELIVGHHDTLAVPVK